MNESISKHFHIQGEVTIYVDYTTDDDDGFKDSEEVVKVYKDWARDEYRLHGLPWDGYDIFITAEEVEEEKS